jgi:hypothetical protein
VRRAVCCGHEGFPLRHKVVRRGVRQGSGRDDGKRLKSLGCMPCAVR